MGSSFPLHFFDTNTLLMNTELTKRVLGLDVPNLRHKDLGLEAVKLTERQVERLMEYLKTKHANWKLAKKVKAFRITYKRRWTNTVKIVWPDIYMEDHLTANAFTKLIG